MMHFHGEYHVKIILDIDENNDIVLPYPELIKQMGDVPEFLKNVVHEELIDDTYITGSIVVENIICPLLVRNNGTVLYLEQGNQ